MTRIGIVILAAAVAVGFACSPQSAAHGDYRREVGARYIVEARGERTAVVARNPMAVRIERFAVKNGCAPELAPELAELLAECRYPRVLAAIACRESRFNLKARGAVGEVGMFQVKKEIWGSPGKTCFSQVRKTRDILDLLVAESGGKLSVAIAKYNGSGSQAKKYAKAVMKLAASI